MIGEFLVEFMIIGCILTCTIYFYW